MSRPTEQTILEELLSSAIESALEARENADSNPFDNGRLMAYYDVITTAKEQATIMGIEFSDKTIAAFDPDAELVNWKRKAA